MMRWSFVRLNETKSGGEKRISHCIVVERARIMMQMAEKGRMPHGALTNA
jgi:hypothetical protein